MTISTLSTIKKLLILFLLFSGLYFAKVFLIPLAIGAVLATLFLPLNKRLERKKLPRGIAAFICLLIFLMIIAFISTLLIFQVTELAGDFVLLKQKALETINAMQVFIFNHLGVSMEKQSLILNSDQPAFTVIMKAVVGSITSVMINFLFVLAYMFLLLYYRKHIFNFFLKLSQPSQEGEMKEILEGIAGVSQQYLLGLAKMIVCLWIMYSIGFSIMGIKNPFFFAILCGLLEIVPFIGNITGTTLTVLISAVQGTSFPILIGIVVTYAIVQFIQGWILEPLIVGPQVKINPFTTVVILVIGELLWGIPGVFLAIPLTAMFKIVCDHIESLKPYGFLIGEIRSGKVNRGFIYKLRKYFNKKQSN